MGEGVGGGGVNIYKILVAADMEGVTGVTAWDHVDRTQPEYARFRRLMTQDVNAAIQGALEAGADETLVADGHGSHRNILLEELDPRARLNAGGTAPFSMVQGIDFGVNGVLFVGYHARAGTQNAILDHTWSSRCVANLWLNDLLVGEAGLNAALCGHFGAPVLMISGDQAVCAEALEMLGPVEVAVVKRATGRMSAECLPPAQAHEKICDAAGRAVRRLKESKAPPPFVLPAPLQVAVELNSSDMADRASLLPEVERVGGRRIEFSAADMPEAYRLFSAAIMLAAAG
jgi:D-amino peptidase